MQVYSHTATELSTLITLAVTKALKEHQSQAKPDNTLITQFEAAELLKVSMPTLQKMKCNNIIPYTQIQRKIYFRHPLQQPLRQPAFS